jgi:hypothetical protein
MTLIHTYINTPIWGLHRMKGIDPSITAVRRTSLIGWLARRIYGVSSVSVHAEARR